MSFAAHALRASSVLAIALPSGISAFDRKLPSASTASVASKSDARRQVIDGRVGATGTLVSTFFLFAIGAIFPVAPYFALSGAPAVITSLAASGAALFLIGAGTTLFTGIGVWFSGIRQLVIGFAAAGMTYGVGKLIGVAVTG